VGAGIAAAAGLLMGAAAKPDLAAGDRPEGPQILAGWSGVRSTGPFDDGATLASYNGQIPDYVLGTDWKRSLEPPRPAPEPRERLARNDLPPPDEDVGFTGGADEEPIRIEPRYPSTDGGLDLAAPEPISDEPGGIG
jgi:hypothetical protein